jgi:hypothetical protein
VTTERTQLTDIERRPFSIRFLRPVGLTLVTWLLLFFVTRNLTWIGNPRAVRTLMNGGYVLLYLAYCLSGLVLYPVMYFRGASLAERIGGCFVTPLAYVVKEIIRVNQFFTLGESLYYALSSIVLGALLIQVGLQGLAELICRALYRKRYGTPVKVFTWQPLVAIAITLVTLYVMLLWDGGVHYFYFYQEGYKLLFQ